VRETIGSLREIVRRVVRTRLLEPSTNADAGGQQNPVNDLADHPPLECCANVWVLFDRPSCVRLLFGCSELMSTAYAQCPARYSDIHRVSVWQDNAP